MQTTVNKVSKIICKNVLNQNFSLGSVHRKTEPIFINTDTDTDFGIYNTEKYRIPTIKYRYFGICLYAVDSHFMLTNIFVSTKWLETTQAATNNYLMQH